MVRAGVSDPSSQREGVGIRKLGISTLEEITRSVKRILSNVNSESCLSCAAQCQSDLSRSFGASWRRPMAWYGLARHLRSIWNLVTAPRDLRMPKCGNRRRILDENTHSTGDRPVRLSKLSPLSATATPGRPIEHTRHSGEPSGHGVGFAG
jgi:hypothetical protein